MPDAAPSTAQLTPAARAVAIVGIVACDMVDSATLCSHHDKHTQMYGAAPGRHRPAH
jgi:hypothetical protein